MSFANKSFKLFLSHSSSDPQPELAIRSVEEEEEGALLEAWEALEQNCNETKNDARNIRNIDINAIDINAINASVSFLFCLTSYTTILLHFQGETIFLAL